MKLEDRIAKELGEIQSRIPKAWLNGVVREVKVAPDVEFIVDEALKSPEVPEEQKAKLRELKEKGEFSRVRYVENPKIAQKIDNFVNREINRKIKKGALPPRSEIPNLPHVKTIYEKLHSKEN